MSIAFITCPEGSKLEINKFTSNPFLIRLVSPPKQNEAHRELASFLWKYSGEPFLHIKIKKTMGHHTLKGVVCGRPLFLGLRKSKISESSQKLKFLKCSKINHQSYPLTKVSGLISDIKQDFMIR